MEMKLTKSAGRKRSASTLQEATPALKPKAPAKLAAAAAAAVQEEEEEQRGTATAVALADEADAAAAVPHKVIMSKAARRKLKKPPVVVTAAQREKAREDKRELRKYLRMVKSNGSRRKVRKMIEKRQREEHANEEDLNAFDSDYRMAKRGRRLE